MKKLILIFALAFSAIAVPVMQTGCKTPVTVEQGGIYSEASLAVTDQAILDANQALNSFVSWYQANQAFLSKYPEVGTLIAKIQANQSAWIRDAYAARDAYASALKAYNAALAAGQAGTSPDHAKIDAALAVLTDITQQIVAYRAAHPITSNP